MPPIMFHYFHDGNKYPETQGSWSVDRLVSLIESKKIHLLSADEWFDKFQKATLRANQTALSFDDGLKEQMEIAVPVLEHYNICGLFNIYTAPLVGEKDRFEIYRHFRVNYFESQAEFYNEFFFFMEKSGYCDYRKVCREIDFNQYLPHAKFYTHDDRKFRYFRDVVLKTRYADLMDAMMNACQVERERIESDCWMSREEIVGLRNRGHLIGIHSHSHPTNIQDFSYEEQKQDFLKNQQVLEEITDQPIEIGAYPCGKYNNDTLSVMQALHIKYALIASNTAKLSNLYPLLIPRIDSANIVDIL